MYRIACYFVGGNFRESQEESPKIKFQNFLLYGTMSITDDNFELAANLVLSRKDEEL